ncbi:hypothetical protein ABBQ32_001555 [Trebouxia sp. C0010 RCD-2024]
MGPVADITDMFSALYSSPFPAVEEVVDNSGSSTASQAEPMIRLLLDMVDNMLKIIDNGDGVGPDGDAAVVKLRGRGDAPLHKVNCKTRKHGRLRWKDVQSLGRQCVGQSGINMAGASSAQTLVFGRQAQKLLLAMAGLTSCLLLQGALARLLQQVQVGGTQVGKAEIKSTKQGQGVVNIWQKVQGSDDVAKTVTNCDSESLQTSGTAVKMENIDTGIWNHKTNLNEEEACAFLQTWAERLAGTYFFKVFDLAPFAGKVLESIANVAGGKTSVNPNLPFFKKPGGADQKKDMNKALEPDPVSNSSSLSSGSLPTLTFRDSQGHQLLCMLATMVGMWLQCGECPSDFKPSLLGPFTGNASSKWSSSPVYHETVVPVTCHAAAASSSAAADKSIGIGLLNSTGNNVTCVLFVGDAIQYGVDGQLGVIKRIDWGAEPRKVLRTDLKLAVHKLVRSHTVSPHTVSAPHVLARPTEVSAEAFQAHLHVLSQEQSAACFPEGQHHSLMGPQVVIAQDDYTMEQMNSPVSDSCSWERTACMCIQLHNDLAVSAICSFAKLPVHPSTEPRQHRLLRMEVPSEPLLAAEEKALLTECSAPAASTLTDLAAIVLDEVGRPCRTSDTTFKLCSNSGGPSTISIVKDRAVYQLPAVTLEKSYQAVTKVQVSLKHGRHTKPVFQTTMKATAVPDGIRSHVSMSLSAQPAAVEHTDSEEDAPVAAESISTAVCAGEPTHVFVDLHGAEPNSEAEAWPNAPDHFDLSEVRLGLSENTMVSATVTQHTCADGSKQFKVSALLPAGGFAIGSQTLLLTGSAKAHNAMDIDSNSDQGPSSSQGANSTVEITGSLGVTLEGGKPTTVQLIHPPESAVELTQQLINAHVLGLEGHHTEVPEGAKLYVDLISASKRLHGGRSCFLAGRLTLACTPARKSWW